MQAKKEWVRISFERLSLPLESSCQNDKRPSQAYEPIRKITSLQTITDLSDIFKWIMMVARFLMNDVTKNID